MPAPAPEENDGQNKASRLPPELRFIAELPDLSQMDMEEKIVFGRQRLKKMREHRDALLAFGWNPDKSIADLEKLLPEIDQVNKEVNAAEDNLLHAHANLADATTDLVKMMQAAIEDANPFDPQVQEWKEELEELRKHIPKEDGP